MISTLMGFFEKYTEEHTYFHLKSIDDPETGAEIMFEEKVWRSRPLTIPYGLKGGWVEFNQDNVEEFLISKDLSVDNFIENLGSKILLKAVYHEMMLEKIVSIIGIDEVTNARAEWEEFASELKKSVDDMTRPKLEVIK